MEFQPIALEDKEIYEKHYKSLYRITSDASFTTPYIWSSAFKTHLYYDDDVLCVQGKNKENVPYYMMPVGNGDRERFLKRLYERCHDLSIPFSLHWLHSTDVTLLEKLFPGRLHIEESRNSAEYVYETEKLILLPGKKLHAKRNHVNAFHKAYPFTIKDITTETVEDARSFVLARCNSADETIAMNRLFDEYFSLDVTGMLLYVDEEIVGVTAGELLTDDTALIHLEKANTDFSGAYASVNQLFIKNYFSHTKYINREEDMGIEGMRKAKLSYHPAFLLEKYTVTEVI